MYFDSLCAARRRPFPAAYGGFALLLALFAGLLGICGTAGAAELTVSPDKMTLAAKTSAKATVTYASGAVSVSTSNSAVAKATYSSGIVTVSGVAAGQAVISVRDSAQTRTIEVLVTASSGGTGGTSTYAVLAANDLGMHCADQDYQIFSILPPFNVVHAQVIKKGSKPLILNDSSVDVYYSGASSLSDPAGSGSINTYSVGPTYKSNFWELTTRNQSYGTQTYRRLYPSVAPLTSALDSFAPLPDNVGLPVPDPNQFPALSIAQQAMPATTPQKFQRYDPNLAFFTNFPFGGTIVGVNWFSADGIPILPRDDKGVTNAYPLLRISAVTRGAAPTSTPLAKLDVVVPVASEADCRLCHASSSDYGSGRATDFAGTTKYASGVAWSIATAAASPGPEPLQNAAKINILRLHDAKHGTRYTSSATGAATPCRNGNEASCLDVRRSIQCSQCHYTPALDLLHAGPVNDTGMGEEGRQQTRHISMSRAMHANHGQYTDIFPDMPAPRSANRTTTVVNQVLQDTCYACHPGKVSKCLRGTMATGGVVCQDCHGQMRQVGNDFSANLASGGSLDLAKRVPWAHEPKCQSCHVGDVLTVAAMDRSNMIVANDGLRLLQAYLTSDAGKDALPNIQSPASRFAENASLYRLSKGHGGVMCKACHGSTHAEWPNANPNANDNVAAKQLQGHTGTIVECASCHTGTLANNLNGPHGIHPVNSSSFVSNHESLAVADRNSCRSCHGNRGQGSVLSRTFADRSFTVEGRTVKFLKGTQVRCDACHEQQL
ncbi:MAG: Ig-like domain-containing protein [Rhodocyclaceae bacterium]|nr:Ig-like domain-containing protein [Rhodocyclaceae bacterium]